MLAECNGSLARAVCQTQNASCTLVQLKHVCLGHHFVHARPEEPLRSLGCCWGSLWVVQLVLAVVTGGRDGVILVRCRHNACKLQGALVLQQHGLEVVSVLVQVNIFCDLDHGLLLCSVIVGLPTLDEVPDCMQTSTSVIAHTEHATPSLQVPVTTCMLNIFTPHTPVQNNPVHAMACV